MRRASSPAGARDALHGSNRSVAACAAALYPRRAWRPGVVGRGPSMRRWLPVPFLSAALLTLWVLLNESAAPGAIILGAALATAVSYLSTALEPAHASFRRPGMALRLALVVLIEIVRSNKSVGQIILGSR